MDARSNPSLLAELDRAATAPLTVDITTTGRLSGSPRRIEIWIVKVGDRLVIGGTPRPRDWLANLHADPVMTLHLTGSVTADLNFVAHEVIDGERRREIWTHPSTSWYRRQTSVEDLVAHAPTVELTPRLT